MLLPNLVCPSTLTEGALDPLNQITGQPWEAEPHVQPLFILPDVQQLKNPHPLLADTSGRVLTLQLGGTSTWSSQEARLVPRAGSGRSLTVAVL